MGAENPNFYSEAAWWPLILVMLKIWQGAGYGTIVYVAAITGFDQGMYEAARIDGATRLQTITRITLPLLKPVGANHHNQTHHGLEETGGGTHAHVVQLPQGTVDEGVLPQRYHLLRVFHYAFRRRSGAYLPAHQLTRPETGSINGKGAGVSP